MHDIVLLHVRVHHLISSELENSHNTPTRHGKAERHDRQEQRRQLKGKPLTPVEQIDQGKPTAATRKPLIVCSMVSQPGMIV